MEDEETEELEEEDEEKDMLEENTVSDLWIAWLQKLVGTVC